MWGIWFILSAMCMGAAAYLLKKRSSYVYSPKEVVYSATKDVPAAAQVPTEPAPIVAEYSVDSRNVSPHPAASFFSHETPVQGSDIPEAVLNASETISKHRPVPEPGTPTLESEMRGAVNAEDMPKNPAASAQVSDVSEENEPPESLKNIRFFDS